MWLFVPLIFPLPTKLVYLGCACLNSRYGPVRKPTDRIPNNIFLFYYIATKHHLFEPANHILREALPFYHLPTEHHQLLFIMSLVVMDVESDAFEVESPSTATKTTLWASLPAEVRQMILKFVCLPDSGGQCNGMSYPTVAQYASVCLEWQIFFEARTFRRLVLNPASVEEFDAVVRRDDVRLAYIQKLWLRVELSEYECPKCDEPEDVATQREYVEAFIHFLP